MRRRLLGVRRDSGPTASPQQPIIWVMSKLPPNNTCAYGCTLSGREGARRQGKQTDTIWACCAATMVGRGAAIKLEQKNRMPATNENSFIWRVASAAHPQGAHMGRRAGAPALGRPIVYDKSVSYSIAGIIYSTVCKCAGVQCYVQTCGLARENLCGAIAVLATAERKSPLRRRRGHRSAVICWVMHAPARPALSTPGAL